MKEQYWASVDAGELASKIKERVTRYYTHVNAVGLMQVWRNSDRLCYGMDVQGGWARSSIVTYGGQEGEIVMLRANHYASLGQSITSMATATRLTMTPHAINNDYKSATATDLARSLIDYYYVEKEIEDRNIEALECMVFAGEAWVGINWDSQQGEVFAYEPVDGPEGEVTRKPIYDGDVECCVKHPVDIVRDFQREDLNHRWIIVREVLNRWDLLAQYPKHEAEILGATLYNSNRQEWLWPQTEQSGGDLSDQVTGWRLYHLPTPALPVGRTSLVVGDAVLTDDVLEYTKLPYTVVSAWRKRKSAFGYARMWDVIALQQAYDSIMSTMVTNHDMTGVVNFWNQLGDDLVVEELSGGGRHLQSATEPKVLKMEGVGQASLKLEELTNRIMETISGVNATARGNIPSNLQSGSGLALVQAMAQEFNHPVQRAFGRGVEREMTHLLEVLQKNATTPRFAQIVGEDRASELKQFKGDDIAPVRRVSVDLGDPMTRSATGRVQLATTLWEKQGITPQQYLNIVRTGRLDEIENPVRSRDLNIKAENQLLMKGQPPKMMVTDNHKIHIGQHLTVLENPQFRDNAPVAAAVLTHIQEHHDAWINSPPSLLFLSGQDPPPPELLPPLPGMSPPDQAPGGGGGPPPPSGGESKPGDPPSEKANIPGASEALNSKMPRMPKNPLQGGGNQPAKKG